MERDEGKEKREAEYVVKLAEVIERAQLRALGDSTRQRYSKEKFDPMKVLGVARRPSQFKKKFGTGMGPAGTTEKTAVRKGLTRRGLEIPTKNNTRSPARYTDGAKRITRTQHNYERQRSRQTLQDLSAAFFANLSDGLKEAEVECGFFPAGNMVLVGANEAGSIQELMGRGADLLSFQKAGGDELTHQAVSRIKRGLDSAGVAKEYKSIESEIEAACRRFVATEQQEEKGAIQVELQDLEKKLATVMRAQTVIRILKEGLANTKKVNVDAAAGLISGSKKDSPATIVLVEPYNKMHAELNILFTYAKTSRAEAIRIHGRKRPCLSCSIGLSFVKNYLNRDVKYNPRAGSGYLDNLDSLVMSFAKSLAVKDLDDIFAKIDNEMLTTHGVSEWKCEKDSENMAKLVIKILSGVPEAQYSLHGEGQGTSAMNTPPQNRRGMDWEQVDSDPT